MAFEDPNGGVPRRGGEDDLMGVHGDVLFADPLGIRKDKGPQPPTGPSRAPQSGALREPRVQGRRDIDIDNSMDDSLDMNLPEHRRAEINRQVDEAAEDPGTVRAWFGYIFGGGTQCCGNRDRGKDAELAKKAAATGRPPVKQGFPDPPSRAVPSNEASNGRRHSGEQDSAEGMSTSDHNRGAPQPRERDDPFAQPKRSGGGGAFGGLDELHKFASDNDPPRDASKKQPPPHEEERRPAMEPPKPQASDPPRRQINEPNAAESLAREKPPEGHLPRKWQWPEWTLNTKRACIEVYVTDEDSAESRWCEAEPQFRVVDKEGNDAYLCAEYEWDGEFYVQDFGPHHVRKRGQDMTVFQMFTLDPTAVNENDFMKDTMNKSVGRRNLDDTDPFMTTKPRPNGRSDSGGGVSSWLERD